MNLVLITAEAIDPTRVRKILDEVSPILGNPCHVLSSTRIVKTNKTQEEIASILQRNFSQAGDHFIVAMLNGPWAAHNCRSFGQCFE